MDKQDQKTIFHQIHFKPFFHKQGHGSKRGFTLIEILLVLAIIGLVLSLGLPMVQTVTSQRINSTTRKFMGLIKTVRNDAILLNIIHRLAINFEDNTWWVEAQRSFQLLSEEPPEDEEEGASNFTYAPKYNKEPIPMPPGVKFDGVLTEKDGYVNEGIVYVHFFPNGFTEQTILYLSKEGGDQVYYSMILRPTLGNIDLHAGAVENFN